MRNKLKAWILLSRPPFNSVGLAPFVLGSVFAWRVSGNFNLTVFLWACVAILLILLSTYYNGEYYDRKEDRLSAEMGKSAFSGGSQMLTKSFINPSHVKVASYTASAFACIIGLLLQFHYKTGIWTIPLGATGMVAGFFYSKPSLRWVQRGVGEIFIAYSYGWLPIAVGFYLQTGKFDPLIHWISLPVACSIFNVILINEFPDYQADSIVGKRNIVVRIGRRRSAMLYSFVAVISWIAFLVSLRKGVPIISGLVYIPFFVVSAVVVLMMSRGQYNNRRILGIMCAITFLVNLATTMSYIVGILFI